MKILIDDGMQIKVGTGIGKYSEYLYNNLKNNNINVSLADYTKNGENKLFQRLKYLLYINSKKYRKKYKDYDIYHYTNFALPRFRIKNKIYITTIHDLSTFIYPRTFSLLYRIYSRHTIKFALKHSTKVLTVSNSVKKEIEQFFPQYSKKVEVIYPGHYYEIKKVSYNDDSYESNKLNFKIEKKKFFLFVGTIEKRKNVGMIIDAFIKYKEITGSDFKLVLAGKPGYGYKEFVEISNRSHYTNDIIFTGYLSKNDINKLYNTTYAYIFASIYEGFGSTQLECMFCNTPLILSNIPTNIEVSSGYGLFFELNNINSLVNCMININNNPIIDIEKYKWENLIKEYINFYNKIYVRRF